MSAQDSNATLLAYALVTSPDPLRVDGRAQLTLAVSNPQDDAVTCSQIVLTIPVGTAGTDLTDGKSAINAQPAQGWSTHVSGGAVTFTPPGAVLGCHRSKARRDSSSCRRMPRVVFAGMD